MRRRVIWYHDTIEVRPLAAEPAGLAVAGVALVVVAVSGPFRLVLAAWLAAFVGLAGRIVASVRFSVSASAP